MANCVVCGEDLRAGPACVRCGHQNRELADMTMGYFVNGWGVLSFLLILPPLFMLLPGISRWSERFLQPIVSTLLGPLFALVVTSIIAFYVFSLRDALHYHSFKRGFRAKPGRSLAFWALVLFVTAILLAFVLGFALTTKDSLIGPPGYPQALLKGMVAYGGIWHQLLKLAMTGVFIFVFVFFALSASLMAVYKYGGYVDREHPAPIFMNEQLLVWVVLQAVEEHLEVAGPPARDAERVKGPEPADLEEGLSISGMSRLESGGIALTVHNVGRILTRETLSVREDRTWYVEADAWGHLSKVEEKALRVTKVAEEVLAPLDAVLTQVRKLLGASAELQVRGLEQLADGSKVLTVLQTVREKLQNNTRAACQTTWRVEADPKGRVTRVKKTDERRRVEAEAAAPRVESGLEAAQSRGTTAQPRIANQPQPQTMPQSQTPITHRSRVTRRQAREVRKAGDEAPGGGQQPVRVEQGTPADAPAVALMVQDEGQRAGDVVPEQQETLVQGGEPGTQVQPSEGGDKAEEPAS